MQTGDPPDPSSRTAGKARPPAAGDARQRFKERVREWRQEAILEAVAGLLLTRGCEEFTMEDVARRVGIAKGSLYLHVRARSDLVDQVLDRWAKEVPHQALPPGLSWEEQCNLVCAALFRGVERGGSADVPVAPAIPCCLRVSPCPHGWSARWRVIAKAWGIAEDGPQAGPAPEGALLGEAIQALASAPFAAELLRGGRLDEAKEIVQRFVAGSRVTSKGGNP